MTIRWGDLAGGSYNSGQNLENLHHFYFLWLMRSSLLFPKKTDLQKPLNSLAQEASFYSHYLRRQFLSYLISFCFVCHPSPVATFTSCFYSSVCTPQPNPTPVILSFPKKEGQSQILQSGTSGWWHLSTLFPYRCNPKFLQRWNATIAGCASYCVSSDCLHCRMNTYICCTCLLFSSQVSPLISSEMKLKDSWMEKRSLERALISFLLIAPR